MDKAPLDAAGEGEAGKLGQVQLEVAERDRDAQHLLGGGPVVGQEPNHALGADAPPRRIEV